MISLPVRTGSDLKLGFSLLDIASCGDPSIRLLLSAAISLDSSMAWMTTGCGVEEVEEDITKSFSLIFLRIQK